MSSIYVASFYSLLASTTVIWLRLASDITEIVRRDNHDKEESCGHLALRDSHFGIAVGIDVVMWFQRERPNFTRWLLAKAAVTAQDRDMALIAQRANARVKVLFAFAAAASVNGLFLFFRS